MPLRAHLLATFAAALAPVGLLDRFKVDGVIASWWTDTQYDLRTLAAQGFGGLVDSWVATIAAALEPDENGKKNGKAEGDVLDHKLVKRLLPAYLDEIAAVEARRAEIEGQLEAAKGNGDDEDVDASDDEAAEDGLTEAEMKALKKDLAAVKKQLAQLQKQLVERLYAARAALDDLACRVLALDLLRADLAAQLDRYVSAHRQEVVSSVELWWDKYEVSLTSIEEVRNRSESILSRIFRELAYGN